MFSRTIPRVWRAVFLFLVAAGILLLPASHPRSLIAQTESADETVAEEPNPAVVFYTKALNVSEEEAWRRLMLQGPMIEVGNKIAEAEPTYAGSWLQHEPEFRLVIALTAPEGQAIVAPYLQGVEWANAVEVVQRPKTIAELEALLNQVGEVTSRVEGVSDLLYGMGLNIPEGKVQFYSPTPEVLRDVLGRAPAFRAAPVALEEMEFVFQAQRLEPAVLRYPYLLGGTFLDGCTASFPVFRHADLRRYMSTAGHCPNHITVQHPSAPSTMSGIYLGPVVTENNPFVTPPVGPRGRQADFQAHATTVRDFDLTNMIRINSTENRRVVSSTRKATTWGAAVCKYGRSSGSTCGFVTNINYRPVDTWGDAFTYVLVGTPFPGEFACPGDSGAPVFLFVDGGPNVAGLGILAASEAGPCDGSSQSFAYTPVDEIQALGYDILAFDYRQYYYQNVFWTETNCTEYRQPVDDNGNPISSQQTSRTCRTSAAPGFGPIQSTTGYVVADQYREGMWRNNAGWIRIVPVNADGTINWGAATPWTQCCSGTAPRAQGDYVVGNTYYQNVFWTEANCTEYKRELDINGNPIAPSTTGPCRTWAPGSGTIQSYTAYVVGDHLREGIWRNNIGYIRNVPLNSAKTDVNWGSAPGWSQCCTGTAPQAQGVYILNHP